MSTLFGAKLRDKKAIDDAYIKNLTEHLKVLNAKIKERNITKINRKKIIQELTDYINEKGFDMEQHIDFTDDQLEDIQGKLGDIILDKGIPSRDVNLLKRQFKSIYDKGLKRYKEAELKGLEILQACNQLENCDLNNLETKIKIDLMGEYKGITFFAEIERDKSKGAVGIWKSPDTWPYNLINMPVEKERYCWEYPKSSFYFKFNSDLSNAFIIHSLDYIRYGYEQILPASMGSVRMQRRFIRIKKEYAHFDYTSNPQSFCDYIITKLEECFEIES